MKVEQLLTGTNFDLREIAKVLIATKQSFSYSQNFQNCNRKHYFTSTYNSLPISICYKENFSFFTKSFPGCRWVSIRYHSLTPAFSLGAGIAPQQTIRFDTLGIFITYLKDLFKIK